MKQRPILHEGISLFKNVVWIVICLILYLLHISSLETWVLGGSVWVLLETQVGLHVFPSGKVLMSTHFWTKEKNHTIFQWITGSEWDILSLFSFMTKIILLYIVCFAFSISSQRWERPKDFEDLHQIYTFMLTDWKKLKGSCSLVLGRFIQAIRLFYIFLTEAAWMLFISGKL